MREQLNLAERNSKSLLSLVNQLLDFRKVESGRIMIAKKQNNLPAFIQSTVVPFEAFAKDRQIEVRCMYNCSLLLMALIIMSSYT